MGGAGPLPLTGLCLAARVHAPILLVDRDPTAVHEAAGLVEALEGAGALPPDRVHVIEADVAEAVLRFDADVVIVASLVDDDAKRAVATAMVEERPGTHVVFRGARGLVARLAYRPLPDLLATGLTPLETVIPAQYGDLPFGVRRSPRGILNTIELYCA